MIGFNILIQVYIFKINKCSFIFLIYKNLFKIILIILYRLGCRRWLVIIGWDVIKNRKWEKKQNHLSKKLYFINRRGGITNIDKNKGKWKKINWVIFTYNKQKKLIVSANLKSSY